MNPDLKELLARVEGATGADRELSVRIWFALHPDPEELWSLSGLNAQREQHSEKTLLRDVLSSSRNYGFHDQDHVTASLDAALALCERVLPGWRFVVGTMPEGAGYYAAVGTMPGVKTAQTPALALIACVLHALIDRAAG